MFFSIYMNYMEIALDLELAWMRETSELIPFLSQRVPLSLHCTHEGANAPQTRGRNNFRHQY